MTDLNTREFVKRARTAGITILATPDSFSKRGQDALGTSTINELEVRWADTGEICDGHITEIRLDPILPCQVMSAQVTCLAGDATEGMFQIEHVPVLEIHVRVNTRAR